MKPIFRKGLWGRRRSVNTSTLGFEDAEYFICQQAKLVGELQIKRLDTSLTITHVDIEFYGEEQVAASGEAESSRTASERQAVSANRLLLIWPPDLP